MRTLTWTVFWVLSAALWIQVIQSGGHPIRLVFRCGGEVLNSAMEILR